MLDETWLEALPCQEANSPLPANDDLCDDLDIISQDELGARFDELAAMASRQPDDKLVFSGLSQVIRATSEAGHIDLMMQMAMTLGAMACLDPHFVDIAGEAGNILGSLHEPNDDHDHQDDKKKCKDCQTKRPCRRHR